MVTETTEKEAIYIVRPMNNKGYEKRYVKAESVDEVFEYMESKGIQILSIENKKDFKDR